MKDGNLDVDFDDIHSFEVGDAVRLKNKILKSKDHRMMGPRMLIDKVGWPNHFYVEVVGVTEDGEPGIILSACCRNITPKGIGLCSGHPASFFEKIAPEIIGRQEEEEERPRRKGDLSGSVVTPLGKVVSYEYRSDEQELVIDILGKKFSVDGAAAKKLADFAKEKGIL